MGNIWFRRASETVLRVYTHRILYYRLIGLPIAKRQKDGMYSQDG